MLQSVAPRWRPVLNSLAYGTLVAVVIGLGYLTFHVISERRHPEEGAGEPAAEATIPLVEFDTFSARRDRTTEAERLNVSLRVRLTAPGNVDCYVFVVARNDHVVPKLWGVWPPQGPGGALTTGGHFRSTDPTTGQAVSLTSRWTRISATIDHPLGHPPFDEVMVYMVGAKGEVLLARPFAL